MNGLAPAGGEGRRGAKLLRGGPGQPHIAGQPRRVRISLKDHRSYITQFVPIRFVRRSLL